MLLGFVLIWLLSMNACSLGLTSASCDSGAGVFSSVMFSRVVLFADGSAAS